MNALTLSAVAVVVEDGEGAGETLVVGELIVGRVCGLLSSLEQPLSTTTSTSATTDRSRADEPGMLRRVRPAGSLF